jgi:di/tricarboxylate transporter
MGPSAWFTLAVVIATVLALAREWVAPSIAVVGAMVVLLVTGVVSPQQAFAGFSNPAPITVAALFVLARAVEKTGVLLPLVAGTLSGEASTRGNLTRLLLPTAGASAFLNNTPIVAMLIPQVSAWAERRGVPISWYLMPLSFAAILGGMVTLIGTSTNLVVSGLLQEAGHAPLGMFEMTGIGLPAALLGLVVLIVLAPTLLPDRRGLKRRFEEEFREFTVEMEVERGGAADGQSVEEAGLRRLEGVFLVRIEREGRVLAPVAPEEILEGGDLLGFVGRADLVVDLQSIPGLRSREHKHTDPFRDEAHSFFEVVVSPVAPLVGVSLKEVGFREQYQAAVLAIHRAGDRVREKLGDVTLRPGDTLLLLADHGFRDRWRDRRDFLVVSPLDGSLPPGNSRGLLTLTLVVGVVLLAAVGLVPILNGALLAAILVVLTGTLTPNEARSAVDLDVILLIAAAFGIGNAIEASGLALAAVELFVDPAMALGPVAVLAAVVLATFLLTELITNNAAAVLMFPVAIAAALSIGVDPRAFAVGVALTASASFLTPIGYQTNTMVYGPGGYHFRDYSRLGLPLSLVVMVVVILLISVRWNLL